MYAATHTLLFYRIDSSGKARLGAGLRQADVESAASVAYRHYQNIEAGKVDLKLDTLWRLARAFKTSVARLVRE